MSRKRGVSSSRRVQSQAKLFAPWFWIALGVLLLGFLAVGLLRSAGNTAPARLPAEISVQEAYRLYQQGYFLLDVRTQEEWNSVHVPNATLIPLDQLPQRLQELPKDQPILVICRSGNRSQTGRDILLQNGFQATSVQGGLRAWQAAGYPVVTP
ncbi:MAG: rhodanese-like domain-containing protein [Chloroflexi bacterium]|jgi:rhodanese-related sulfurtransferase|nr:rhodanese-like domain-containing protein [Chloroflexota bacterium]